MIMCTCSAHQQGRPLIPLMAQKGYNANGWLGLLLNTALWFPMYGLEDADDATFEAKVRKIKCLYWSHFMRN